MNALCLDGVLCGWVLASQCVDLRGYRLKMSGVATDGVAAEMIDLKITRVTVDIAPDNSMGCRGRAMVPDHRVAVERTEPRPAVFRLSNRNLLDDSLRGWAEHLDNRKRAGLRRGELFERCHLVAVASLVAWIPAPSRRPTTTLTVVMALFASRIASAASEAMV